MFSYRELHRNSYHHKHHNTAAFNFGHANGALMAIVYWEGCPPGPMTRIMEEEGFLNPSLDFFEIVLTTKIW